MERCKTTDDELLPCPFCGGEARMIYDLMSDGYGYNKIACKECGANVPENYSKEGDQATWDWNNRYERTCHVVESHTSWDEDLWKVVLSCGHEHLVPFEELPLGYCSDCGAKVVDE